MKILFSLKGLMKLSCISVAIFSFTATAIVSDSIEITVTASKLQKFGGFGMHQGSLTGSYGMPKFYKEYADSVAQVVIKDLKITHGRVYPNIGASQGNSVVAQCLASWDDSYIAFEDTIHIWDYWKKFSPDMFWICSFYGNSITGAVVTTVDVMKPYCDSIASVIKALAAERDMHFSWVGIINEPNDTKEGIKDTIKAADGITDSIYTRRRVPPEMYPAFIKTMRQSLDDAGLDTCKIMIPEVSSVDAVCYEYLDYVKKDSAALAAVGVLFSKAYNMCASTQMKEFALENSLPYLAAAGANCMEGGYTGAGDQFPFENTGDNTHFAADLACRIFNDFNHGVSHWAWYLNIDDFYAREPSHRIGWAFTSRSSARQVIADTAAIQQWGPDCFIVLSLKYYYLKHLAHTLDAGGTFRECRVSAGLPSGMSADMWYTYGLKPSVNATAIVNPDTTLTVALVNMTGGINDTTPQPKFAYFDSTSYMITVKIDELADVPSTRFGVVRSNRTEKLEAQDSVTATNGVVRIAVEPLELITLRSEKIPSVSVRDPYAADPGRMTAACHAAAGSLMITLPSADPYAINIFRANGAAVVSRIAQSATARIDISRLPAGIYYVSIGNGTYRLQKKIFIR